MPNIYLYGSYDRFNFGDILFPLIFETYFKSNRQSDNSHNPNIVFVSPFSGNEIKRGGVKTKSIRAIFKKIKKQDTLIVVGGDVLTASWLQLYLHRYGNDLKFRILHKILSTFYRNPNKAIDHFIRFFYGVKQLRKPYAISKGKKNFKLIYNSAGGSSIPLEIAKRYYEEVIANTNLFSVRDNTTKSMLPKKESIPVVPDLALVVKEMIPLSKTKSPIIEQKYFVFQAGKNYITNDNIKQITSGLNTLISQTGQLLILLPIGTAHGHEDHLALKKISEYLHPETYKLIENPKIYDIIKIIADADFFIGTSLHGAITSMSFANPHFYLDIHIKKLEAYLKTWQIDPFSKPLALSAFSESIIEFLKNDFAKNEYKKNIKEQKELVMSQLKSINQIIFSN